MRKILVGIIMLMTAAVSYGQQPTKSTQKSQLDHKVVCDSTEKMMKRYMEGGAQQPIVIGNANKSLNLSKKIPDGAIVVLYNKYKDRFTIIQFNMNIACVLAHGNSLEISASILNTN
jgi:hypothetical protein